MPLSERDCREIRGVLRGKATNVRYRDLERWLGGAGFAEHGVGSSHRTWRHAETGMRVPSVDSGRGQVLPVYVKKAARAILAVGGCP